jgi:hypothetical protein
MCSAEPTVAKIPLFEPLQNYILQAHPLLNGGSSEAPTAKVTFLSTVAGQRYLVALTLAQHGSLLGAHKSRGVGYSKLLDITFHTYNS